MGQNSKKIMGTEKVDIVIVGAGPAGLAAAAEIAQHGGHVVVLDEAPFPGGRLPGQIHPKPDQKAAGGKQWSDGSAKAIKLADKAIQAGASVICGASVWGIFRSWHVAVAATGHYQPTLVTGYDARAVIIATGATQNPLVMNGWTLPGVITAGAAQSLINIHHVLPGRNTAVIGIDPLSLSVAQLLSMAGSHVHGIVLPMNSGLQWGPSSPQQAVEALATLSDYAPRKTIALLGKISAKMSRISALFFPKSGITINRVRLLLRQAALSLEGKTRVERIIVTGLSAHGKIRANRRQIWPVDAVITSAGLSPLTELAQVAGCTLVHIPDLGGWVPLHSPQLETPLAGLFVAGSITGVEGAQVAEAQGRLVGVTAAGYLGLTASSITKQRTIKCQAAVKDARKNSIAFLPNIEKGRCQLHCRFPSS